MNYYRTDKYYFIKIEKNEEIIETLLSFCQKQNLKLGKISGIGATNNAVIGLFETTTKTYHSATLTGDHEMTSITGNLTTKDGKPYLHLHITLANSKYETFGGHLTSAIISATCEIILEAIDGAVEREFNKEIGLNLFKLSPSPKGG